MSNETTPAGDLFVISAPSGAGKTSLINALLARRPGLALSVSDTTREPRRGEVDGRHYHFVTAAEFEAGIERGNYLEHARVFDNYYGTRTDEIHRHWSTGRDVLLEIDVQGAAQVRTHYPDAASIFILPPSLAALKQRLTRRALDEPDVIARRLEEARFEIRHCEDFGFLVVNQDFDRAADDITAIIDAWPLRGRRQRARYTDLIAELLA